jgi:hypothetical protein
MVSNNQTKLSEALGKIGETDSSKAKAIKETLKRTSVENIAANKKTIKDAIE